MQRREALKLLASAAALQLLSREAFSLFQSLHEELPETAALRTLNPMQNAIVTILSELIIPQTDTPGAKAVRVNEFMDLVLTDWCDEKERSQFFSGLSDVNSRSRDVFGKDFADCTMHQQWDIVAAFDEELSQLREASPPGLLGGPPPVENSFFEMMKRLTLIGYSTSQVGFERQLHQQIMPRKHCGCANLNDLVPSTD